MSRIASLRSSGTLVYVALAGILLFTFGKTAWADQIDEFYAATSRSYQATSNTNVQDVRPLVDQRGVNLDGSLRAGASLPMALAGNPSEPGAGGGNLSGVRLDTGTYVITDVDLALPATGFSWVIGRSYNCRQKDSGGSYIVSDGFQGKCWFQLSEIEIAFYDAGNGQEDKDVVYLVYGADRYIEFKRQSKASNQFKAKNGAAGVIDYAAGASTEPDTYTYTDQAGNKFVFFGWNDPDVDDDIEGMLWKMTDPAGNVAYVGDATTGSTALSGGYDATIGAITKAYDTSDRRYTYTYTCLTHRNLCQNWA